MIPKIFHTIWLGPNTMPEKFRDYIDSWHRFNPGWESMHWTDENLGKLINQRLYDKATTYSERSDIVRFEKIYEYGGLYHDTDYECLQNIEAILQGHDFVTCREPDNQIPANQRKRHNRWYNDAILGAVPGHPFIKHLIDNLPDRIRRWEALTEKEKDKILCHCCWKVGPCYFTDMLKGHDMFIHAPEVWNWVYARHHYSNSWNKPEGQI